MTCALTTVTLQTNYAITTIKGANNDPSVGCPFNITKQMRKEYEENTKRSTIQ